MKKAIVLLGVLVGATAMAQSMAGFENLDFEKGIDGWGVWYSDGDKYKGARYPYSADTEHVHSGKQSLKIVGAASEGRAFINRSSEKMKLDTRYEVGYWSRVDGVKDEDFKIVFNFREKLPDGKLKWLKSMKPILTTRKKEGEWRYRTARFRSPNKPFSAQLGLYLQDAQGTIYIDDIVIRELSPEEDALANLWIYDPYRVKLGREPESKFRALAEKKAPILERAKKYNELLVASAYAKEQIHRLARAAHYARQSGAAAPMEKKREQMERDLAEVYELYGKAYLDQENAEAARIFDQAAVRLEAAIDGVRREALAEISKLQKSLGRKWEGQPEPLNAGLPEISPEGKVNQIIYGTRSMSNHSFMETPLDINGVHSTTCGRPKSEAPGQYDWSPYFDQWKKIQEDNPNAKRSCLVTFFVLHDSAPTPKWMVERIKQDPELLLQTQPKAEYRKWGGRMQLNWWHPEVQAFARECLTSMGETMKSHPEFLFYNFQYECYGPYVGCTKPAGRREVGYSSHGKKSFRNYLKAKYGSIEKLNKEWPATYPSFDAIEPPPDKFLEVRKRPTPLTAEWEKWREDSYVEWCKLVYETLKKADPNKPVLAGHSQVFDWFSVARIYETCDMLGYHSSGRRFMPVTLYINSLSRYNGYKPVAQYENFWGIQEHHDRMTEELPQRHNMQKHVFRLTAWNRFMQIWWYSYTTADYLTHYDGNWFDPSYALTTLRYRAAGLPVYKDKFKRIERTLLESKIVPSRICFLHPSASMRNQYPHRSIATELFAWYDLLFAKNYLFEVVPEEYFLDGHAKLEDFDVMILPLAVSLPTEFEKKLEAWLRGGKRVVLSSGTLGLYDEIGRDSCTLFRKVFGDVRPVIESPDDRTWQWKIGDAEDVMRSGRCGESEVFMLLQSLGKQLEDSVLCNRLISVIANHTKRAASSKANRFELVLRKADNGTAYLCVINPDVDKAHEDVVSIAGEYGKVTDIDIDGAFPIPVEMKDGRTAFSLRLEPCEATIIRLRK